MARTPLSSTLGKRAATDAGLESDSSATRRALHSSQARSSTLERRLADLTRERTDQDTELATLRARVDELTNMRSLLLADEERQQTRAKQNEDAWRQERNELVRKLKDTRTAYEGQRGALADIKGQYSALAASYNSKKEEGEREVSLLEGRLKEVEGERDGLRAWHRRAQALAIELEEQKRKAEEGARERMDGEEGRKRDLVVRAELERQAQHLVTLQSENDSLQVELYELRKFKTEADGRERTAKENERVLKVEINELNVELRRARTEVDSLTQPPPSTEAPTESAATLQGRLAALSQLHAATTAQLAAATRERDNLHARHTAVSKESAGAMVELRRRMDDAERELRWAKEGRRSAEMREKLAREELDVAFSAGTGSGPAGSGDQAQLESLLKSYRSQLEALARDSRDAEERIARSAGLVGDDELAAAQHRAASLEKELASRQDTIDSLTSANTGLDAEVAELMLRVGSGEFNAQRERCLELRGNPAAKVRAVRQERLDKLELENAALLARLAEVDPAPENAILGRGGAGLVPRESFDRLASEKAQQEEAHEKRLRRLKEIFGAKSREFLEAVYSLLGWRIRFDENGADIRLTSMYAPKGKMGLSLKFTSSEGHFGTMAMSGGMARGLEEARDFWVVERQSIPGFLAQVTSEMFEKTTLGRVAGYVGLD